MTPLQQRTCDTHRRVHGTPPAVLVRAPGRVNLIGEHTDYNGGWVLPCAIDYETVVAAAPREDGCIVTVAADYGDARDAFDLAAPIGHRGGDASWAEYVRGAVVMLQRAGHLLRGASLTIAGDVPQGAGLSSSASLEVALLKTLAVLQGLVISPTELALIAQRAENDFVGCQCGIMDPLISAQGRAGHALLIDCRNLGTSAVPLPHDLAVMIVHSRVARGLVDSAYDERRRQCEAAARHYGVPALRDLDEDALQRGAAGLDPVVLRRARHVVTENRRAMLAAQALAAHDLQRLGRLMADSHDSMRDDFEITVPAIDRLVQVTRQALRGEGGARMTGGGFGGCIVALMPGHAVAGVRVAIKAGYRSPDGEPPLIWVCRACDGAGVVEISPVAPPR